MKQSWLLVSLGLCQLFVGIGMLVACALFAIEKFVFQRGGSEHLAAVATWLVVACAGVLLSVAGFFLVGRWKSQPQTVREYQESALKSLALMFLMGAGIAGYYGVAAARGTGGMYDGFAIIFGVAAAGIAAVSALIIWQAIRILGPAAMNDDESTIS